MRFLSTAYTDIGISKTVNQDAFCLKIAKASTANIAFAVLCDGMGGLNNGEFASASVVNAFASWFAKELPVAFAKGLTFAAVAERWNEIAIGLAQKLLEHGQANGISLGTTLTAVLIVNDKFISIHVGDSRLYKISDAMHQITEDQTVAALEIQRNRMTIEQAKNDQRSSILLQCIGASRVVEPAIYTGTVAENDAFMLCSDGFRHLVSEEEMYQKLSPMQLTSEDDIKNALCELVELNKSRGENDNITSLLIKVAQ